MIRVLLLLLLIWPALARSEALVAAHTIPSRAILGPADVLLATKSIPGALEDPAAAIGMEARVVLYAGRPIRAADLVPPALVDRNEIVLLTYRSGPLRITAEGRALDRGAVGDRVRIMNLASRTTVTGRVAPDGTIHVGPPLGGGQ